MEKLKEFIEKNKPVLAVILFCFSTRLFLYPPVFPNWDEATYIQIGKYFFSAGQIGFLEPFRPLLWPVILGFFWKLNCDPVISGHVLTVLFSLGNFVLVYCIGKKVYGAPAGILAALLLGISPSFFFWGNGILTEIPASFLGLLSVYLTLRERYFWAGLVGVIAFSTKFVQIFTLLPVGCFVIYKTWIDSFKGFRSPLIRYCLGCALTVFLLTVVYLVLYGNIFLPFLDARQIYTQIPYRWSSGIYYALQALSNAEGAVLIFVPLAVVFSRRFITKEQMVVLAIAFLQFLWVGKLPTALLRFLLSTLPYVYLLAAAGMVQSYNLTRGKWGRTVFAALLVLLLGIQCYRTMTIRFPASQPNILYEYSVSHQKDITGTVWISNPATTVDSHLRVDERMYYPVFDLKKIAALRSNLVKADFIFVDSNDLRCRPPDLAVCVAERSKLFETIKRDFYADLYFEEPSTNRISGVFRKEKDAK